jgi:soluble lytic murein transglycosylase-like protein
MIGTPAHAAVPPPREASIQRVVLSGSVAHTYLVQPGDTLWAIAQRFYRDPQMWTHIYRANRAQIRDPNLIFPGQELTIPQGASTRTTTPPPPAAPPPAAPARTPAAPRRAQPGSVAYYLHLAARGTGLPVPVIAAQVQVESGYNPSAVSPAGAEGPYQFMPSTWAGLGFPAGQEFNWATSTRAYITYMRQLLTWSHGNVRLALAAYNAGPADWPAGLGYADQILRAAGNRAAGA